MNSHIVSDAREFDEAMRYVREGFTAGTRLPAQVFRGTHGFRICEFEHVMTTAFWQGIRSMARHTGDAAILCAVLEPDPEYFRSHFGYYGVLSFDVAEPAEAYEDLLATEPPESSADSFLYNTGALAGCSPSLRWRFWAEREIGLVIVALDGEAMFREADFEGVRWMSVDEALHDIVALAFPKQIVPPDFEKQFRLNYLKGNAAT